MEQQSRQYHDEINLYDLWKIIAKRKTFLIVLFLVTVISTAIVSSFIPKIYRGEALLNILQYEEMLSKDMIQAKEIVQPKEIVDMIGVVDKEKRVKIFSATYASITDLKLKPIKESRDKIVVTIDTKNVDHIARALSELVAYINNFDIVKMTVSEEKEKLLKRSTELSNIINSSANLSETYRKLLKEGRLLPVGFNPVDLDKRIADIKIEKLTVDQLLRRINNGAIEIAKQPYIHNKPVKPKIIRNLVLASAMSIVIGIFLVFLSDYIEKIKNAGRE